MPIFMFPYDRDFLQIDLDEARVAAILTATPAAEEIPGEETVRAALRKPLSSPTLAELSRGKRNVVVITSDHTRPIPSWMTIPLLLAEIRRGNPGAEITILVGMGTHRLPTEDELRSKFGEEVFRRERIILHHGDRPSELAGIGQLPSGYPLEINRRAAEADLLLAEGSSTRISSPGFPAGRNHSAGHRRARHDTAQPLRSKHRPCPGQEWYPGRQSGA